jgi:hypoxanthine phosphoribosyltransferase
MPEWKRVARRFSPDSSSSKKLAGQQRSDGFITRVLKELVRTRPARRPHPVPPRWRKDLDSILISEPELKRRIRSLTAEIQRDFRGRDLVVVSLLNGTVMFLADLIRQLSIPMRLDFMGVSSYREGTRSRELIYTKELRLDVRGRDVLLVDDILDTGRTLKAVIGKLRKLKPGRIRTCVLLDKAARRTEPVTADYVGFSIPDLFVVGYGLDFAERYRNLPFVAVLRPHIYNQRAA